MNCNRRMLEPVAVFLFSPSALRASLQTSSFQVLNRPAGVAMSLVKQTDVKNHLSLRQRANVHRSIGSISTQNSVQP